MNVQGLRDAFKTREETNDEWQDAIEKCWEQEAKLLSEDVAGTIDYLDSECTQDELAWISEIFEELLETTQSRSLLNHLGNAIDRLFEGDERNHMHRLLEYGASYLME